MKYIKWDRKDILNYIDEFNTLYSKRPIKNNNGGMTSSHLFPVWYIIKKLKPKYIIESGVWYGLGTWFFEQAHHYSKIISIDPDMSNLKYKSEKVIYQTEDFLESNWSDLPKNDTLIFLDDHQDSLERIKHCYNLGFKKIIIEDNYPNPNCGCYSPKIILSNEKYYYGKMIYEPIQENFDYLNNIIDIYQEMPPIFKDEKTRWNTLWDEKYPTVSPLLEIDQKDKYPLFFNESKGYTWLCYIELK